MLRDKYLQIKDKLQKQDYMVRMWIDSIDHHKEAIKYLQFIYLTERSDPRSSQIDNVCIPYGIEIDLSNYTEQQFIEELSMCR